MPVDVNTLWVFRIIHYQNLEYILQHGIYYRGSANFPADYVNIGNTEIISSRDTKPVTCYPGTMVNNYVPFYFAVRTPMLYNIKTGYGKVERRPQEDIIYLCCNVRELTDSHLQCCFTNGNAAIDFTTFYTNTADLNTLDWHSIRTKCFSDDNPEGDTDRKRKKHAEFLVKDHVPIQFVKKIVVYNQLRHDFVTALVQQYNLPIEVLIDPRNQFYFR